MSRAMPWNKLLALLNETTDFPNHPLFDVMVTFHDDRNKLDVDIPGMEPLYTWTEGAKFKLMIEYTAINAEMLLMRMEFDTNVLGWNDVGKLEGKLVKGLEGMTQGLDVEDIKTVMRAVPRVDGDTLELNRDELFGVTLAQLECRSLESEE